MTSPSQHLETWNPATGERLHTYVVTDPSDIPAMVSQSRHCFDTWKQTDFSTRQAVFSSVIRQIHQQSEALATLISQESGKPLKDAKETDLATAVAVLDYYKTHGPRLLRPKRYPIDKSILLGQVHYERRYPRGVVGIISPWNYPLAIPASGLAATLMAGNSAILKPSELTPGTGEALVQLFRNALKQHHLPEDIVQLLIGYGDTGAALVESGPDYIIFTGSHTVGRKIQQAMQAQGKAASLELGGNDPMIVLEGADPEWVTSHALWGRFTNAGQACAAVKRLLIPSSMASDIIPLLQAKVEQLLIGSPQDPASQVGPLISEKQRQTLEAQLQDAMEDGTILITGGQRLQRPGWFFQPTLLQVTSPDARLHQQELFGPVLPIISYTTIEEAIQIANKSPYALTASVFGPEEKARQVAGKLQAGCVSINGLGLTTYALPALPWSGWKNSGPGTSHGKEGLLDATLRQVETTNFLHKIPLFRKPPWHFSKPSVSPSQDLSCALLNHFASESWLDKLNPGLLLALLKNKASTKL